MAKTIQDKLVSGLNKLGFKPTETRSRYLAFSNPQYDLILFVGSKGALRAGKNATESHSLQNTAFYKKILAAA